MGQVAPCKGMEVDNGWATLERKTQGAIPRTAQFGTHQPVAATDRVIFWLRCCCTGSSETAVKEISVLGGNCQGAWKMANGIRCQKEKQHILWHVLYLKEIHSFNKEGLMPPPTEHSARVCGAWHFLGLRSSRQTWVRCDTCEDNYLRFENLMRCSPIGKFRALVAPRTQVIVLQGDLTESIQHTHQHTNDCFSLSSKIRGCSSTLFDHPHLFPRDIGMEKSWEIRTA